MAGLLRKKRNSKKAALLFGAVYCVAMATLATSVYITYSWFGAQRTAEVNFSDLQVASGLSVKTFYSPINQTNQSGYPFSGFTVPSSYTALTGTGSEALFVEGTVDNNLLAPTLAKSYLFEVTNNQSVPSGVALYLENFTSTASTTAFYSASGVKGDGVRLSPATNVYGSFFLETGALAAAKGFIQHTGDYASGSYTYSDVFSHSETSGSSLTELWATSATGVTIDSGAKAYFIVTIAFDDSSSSHYVYDSVNSTSDESLYSQSDAGDSNCFANLSIVFPSVMVTPV